MNSYTCTRCGKRFKPREDSIGLSCAVLHTPGQCCHYNEQESPEKPHPYIENEDSYCQTCGLLQSSDIHEEECLCHCHAGDSGCPPDCRNVVTCEHCSPKNPRTLRDIMHLIKAYKSDKDHNEVWLEAQIGHKLELFKQETVSSKMEPVSNSDKLEHVKNPNKLPEQLSSKMEHTDPSLNNWEKSFNNRYSLIDDWDCQLYKKMPSGWVAANDEIKEFIASQITLAIQKEREETYSFIYDLAFRKYPPKHILKELTKRLKDKGVII